MRALTLALLALATFVAFGGAIGNGWLLYDDPEYVLDEPLVNGGWSFANAAAFLTRPHGANWHPLTSWTHMLDVQFFGLQPGPPHAINVLLHALAAVLLVLALARLTGAWWRCVVAGALFALHPLRVESVAWVAERKDVLSGALFMLVLWTYARWAERPGRWRWSAVIVTLALGLMAKPMLVTVPFVLVLLDVWPLRRLASTAPDASRPRGLAPARPLAGLLAEKWPLVALALASAVLTFLVQRGTGAMAGGVVHGPAERLANAILSYARYAGATLWPAKLGAFYPYDRTLDVPRVVFAALALVAALAVALGQARQRPWFATGLFWYMGMLVPVLGLVQVGGQARADRYTYLPMIGLAIALVWGADELAARWRARTAAIAAAALATLALAVATARQVGVWKDSRTLFEHTLAVTRDNAVAHQGLGNALMEAGQTGPALAQFEAAARIDPTLADLQNTLGSALGMQGRMDEAIAHFRAGLLQRETAEGHHNLGLALATRGRTDEAVGEFEAALRLRPDGVASHVQLGALLLALGHRARAEAHARRALELDPGDEAARRLQSVLLNPEGSTADPVRQP